MSRFRVLVLLAVGLPGAVCAQSGAIASATYRQFEYRARPFCASEWRAAHAVQGNRLAPSLQDRQGGFGAYGDDALRYSLDELQQKISRRESSGNFRDPINAYVTCLYRYRARELTAETATNARIRSFTNISTPKPTDRLRAAPPADSIVLAPTSPTIPVGGTNNALDTSVPGVRSNCDGVTEIPHTLPPQYRVSAASPFAVGCDGVAATGTLYANSEVEPSLAISPVDPNNLIGTWQQDRWSDGGSHGIMTGVSQDGGVTWSLHPMPFSRCGGGANVGADYARATDPWVTFSPNGTAHMFALAFNGGTFKFGSSSAMLVSRSINGGTAWSNPIELIHDGVQFFNDKNAITADPTDSNYVYAVWDRLVSTGGGPTYFARTTNGGVTWEAAHAIYDPGPTSQTIGNVIAVRSDGLVIDLFTELDEAPDHSTSGFIGVIRSSDKGVTWSAPTNVAALWAIGVSDPETGQMIRDGSLIPQIAIAPNGTIYVVWQDARFSGGLRDGIAMSHSTDGGVTWSTPVRINRKLSVQAFQPNVQVRADGTIAVSYYDLSSNTSDSTTLLTDYWLAQSTDGAIWRWDRISPAFNLDVAPDAEGLFVGDYQGFVSKGTQSVPFFVRTNTGDLANRTDVFSAPAAAVPSGAPPVDDIAESIKIAMAPQPQPISASFRQRVHENIVRNAEGLPGWRNGVRRRPGPPPPDIDRHWRGPR